MAKYAFVINGQNLLIKFEGRVQRLGFYTTRWIESAEIKAAEKLAYASIRKELEGQVLNGRDDPPILVTDKMYEVEDFDGVIVPGKGFTWYAEDEEDVVN